MFYLVSGCMNAIQVAEKVKKLSTKNISGKYERAEFMFLA